MTSIGTNIEHRNEVERHLNSDCWASCISMNFLKYSLIQQQSLLFVRPLRHSDTKTEHGDLVEWRLGSPTPSHRCTHHKPAEIEHSCVRRTDHHTNNVQKQDTTHESMFFFFLRGTKRRSVTGRGKGKNASSLRYPTDCQDSVKLPQRSYRTPLCLVFPCTDWMSNCILHRHVQRSVGNHFMIPRFSAQEDNPFVNRRETPNFSIWRTPHTSHTTTFTTICETQSSL